MLGFPIASYPVGAGPNSSAGIVQLPVVTPDTTPPTLAGPITLTAVTTSGAHAAWSAGSDNVAVAGYEISVDTGTPAWTDIGNVLAYDISGKAAGTYTVRVRDYDGATPRNYSTLITATLVIAAAPVVDPPSSTPPVPTAADICIFTIMQLSAINLSAPLGPTAINLTVSLS